MLKFLRAYWFWILWPVLLAIGLVVMALMSDDSSAFAYPL